MSGAFIYFTIQTAAAAAAADPNPGFAQSYVDEKLKAQADRHARAMAGLKEKHAREIQEKKDKHVAVVEERAKRILRLEEACARLRARHDLLTKDKSDLAQRSRDSVRLLCAIARASVVSARVR
eukprot:SAG22_NODE_2320_length_2722_cov_2.494472_1_plen_124_part_00